MVVSTTPATRARSSPGVWGGFAGRQYGPGFFLQRIVMQIDSIKATYTQPQDMFAQLASDTQTIAVEVERHPHGEVAGVALTTDRWFIAANDLDNFCDRLRCLVEEVRRGGI